MSRLVAELEAILAQLIAEHRKLLEYLAAFQAAMKKLDSRAMDQLGSQQEASRVRIAGLENRRRAVIGQLAKTLRIEGDLTLSKLAALHPPRAAALLKLRTELREAIESARGKAHVAGRIAGAVLGHLNTAVRLLTGAVEKAGVYTKYGVPKAAARIGVMDAVG